MTDVNPDFPGVLAAVIPLVLLALVVESRRKEQADLEASATAGRLIWLFLKALFVLGFLAFWEIAVLLAAADVAGPCLSWLAGPPGAIGVGILLVLTGRIGMANLAYEHPQITGSHKNRVEALGGFLLTVAIAAGMSFIIAYFPPTTRGCNTGVLNPWVLGSATAVGFVWAVWGGIKNLRQAESANQPEPTANGAAEGPGMGGCCAMVVVAIVLALAVISRAFSRHRHVQ
ncbi:hypothetical protein [Streptomyces sp. NPDC052107]|uniref:hypothetical protein n=1 Tax=Streptomyces sp. NPDC052107 TaxID=3155632 RepID=UPI003441CAD2